MHTAYNVNMVTTRDLTKIPNRGVAVIVSSDCGWEAGQLLFRQSEYVYNVQESSHNHISSETTEVRILTPEERMQISFDKCNCDTNATKMDCGDFARVVSSGYYQGDDLLWRRGEYVFRLKDGDRESLGSSILRDTTVTILGTGEHFTVTI